MALRILYCVCCLRPLLSVSQQHSQVPERRPLPYPSLPALRLPQCIKQVKIPNAGLTFRTPRFALRATLLYARQEIHSNLTYPAPFSPSSRA
eukprot:1788797-Pleurochrysis_carterae.AAC.1